MQFKLNVWIIPKPLSQTIEIILFFGKCCICIYEERGFRIIQKSV